MFPYNTMAKIETLHNGRHLIIDRFSDNAGIPNSDMYRVSTFNNDYHYHDEISLTEDQWEELKKFAINGSDGIVCEPFSEREIEDEFKPRFGGVNPKYVDFCRSAWNAAFEYVNKKILEAKV